MEKVILIVDDDYKNLKLERDLLDVCGYRTIQATDGKQGVELAKKQKPNLILMDIMMPVMDGYSACYALKKDKETREIPVIMVTAVDFELNRKLAVEVSADGYITKPFDRRQLIDTIRPFLS